jgi:hypothetical protein
MSNFGVMEGMAPTPKSLTEKGATGCKRSNTSLFDWQTLAAKLFRQNK